ncbi:MAG: hypothetical protein J6O04_09695 [Selenomonadaceae bacterium]|nr:hypothetical protein [Selenomonadaceae bacterium]
MADITMCRGENCDVREKCYRYTAPVSRYWQSVFAETPTGKPCEHFWDNAVMFNGKEAGIWWKMEK